MQHAYKSFRDKAAASRKMSPEQMQQFAQVCHPAFLMALPHLLSPLLQCLLFLFGDRLQRVACRCAHGWEPASHPPLALGPCPLLLCPQGRVWTGRQALANGLVDALGGVDKAVQLVGATGGSGGEPARMG